jgi:cyclase
MSWTRRDFIGTCALGLAGAAMPRALTAAVGVADPFTEVRRGVGTFAGRGGTIGWLANGSGAAVVDSQFPDTAQDFLAGFRGRGASTLDVLLNTHHHFDHTGGNGVLRPEVRSIVAHTRAAELQQRAAETNPQNAQPHADTTFDREWSTSIGDETVRAKHYGPAHTGGDATIFFERASVVHMGDLVFNRAYPFIDRQGGASIDGWIGLLEAVAAEHDADTIYIFGHAREGFSLTGGRADVLVQRDFLSAALETAKRARAAGQSREEATDLDRLPGFDDHAALADWLTLGTVLGAAYDEVSGT